MQLVVDAMGGDLAPKAPVEGAVLYCKETKGKDQIILMGDETIIQSELDRYSSKYKGNISIIHAPDVIEMQDQPTVAIRQKKDSSMIKGITLYKDKNADAFISAGSTGAQMAASLLVLGRIEGVNRPGLGAFLPCEGGVVLLIDVGANPDCKPLNLVQYGIMGSIFIKQIYGIDNPRIALLNIGEEPNKGNDLSISTHELMVKLIPNFIGNLEGRDILRGNADVIITNGFTGNIILKLVESIFGVFGRTFKRSIGKNLFSLTGALLVRHVFRDMKRNFDYQEYGGVPLLGIDGISIICHGSSSAKAIKNAIKVAGRMSEKKVNENIHEEITAKGISWQETQLSRA
jgi:glycerol-3-phosphate acyltransferase PlsX